ncbi:hypothetical protein OIU76_006346 [Salix suchowensis]|nr:hypothetical protein OIU76_006346 [Salix suchowensis]
MGFTAPVRYGFCCCYDRSGRAGVSLVFAASREFSVACLVTAEGLVRRKLPAAYGTLVAVF